MTTSLRLSRASIAAVIVLIIMWLGAATMLWAQPPAPQGSGPFSQAEDSIRNDWRGQVDSLKLSLIRLPIAAALSAVLAFRPRRRGTPARQVAVIQTQIILAIVGAIVMLVVGASLARAFGIVGAAGLIRYRAKIDDPKDAGVMLSTLALGLASGVGLYLLALFAMTFVLAVLWILESIEPEPSTVFELTVSLPGAADRRDAIEQVLRRARVKFELRGSSADDVKFEVRVPDKTDMDRLSTAIAALDTKQTIDVTWDKKKDK